VPGHFNRREPPRSGVVREVPSRARGNHAMTRHLSGGRVLAGRTSDSYVSPAFSLPCRELP